MLYPSCAPLHYVRASFHLFFPASRRGFPLGSLFLVSVKDPVDGKESMFKSFYRVRAAFCGRFDYGKEIELKDEREDFLIALECLKKIVLSVAGIRGRGRIGFGSNTPNVVKKCFSRRYEMVAWLRSPTSRLLFF
ncbi:hypothetical protein V6N12_028982 [Hibiscus sabdariffa]|uniref:Uncharacterized protein n=1 Tax=Hibiscus sabdariffa TaxID=183260 RepID=A0ABR2F7E7_9ROSI